jgi:Penicillin-binding Protein dimerisation domain/Penicillin binding protein transpeptidase domain
VFQAGTALSTLTSGLSDGVVGMTGPVTAEELSQLGAPYTARDTVGQTGLEQADERQLAGAPGATIAVVSARGAQVATLATLAPQPGSPVTTTIEPSVQRAAEAALAGEKKSAALVAVSASTGAVLAAVSVNSGGFDQAIDGGFPPGSTFKVVTSSARAGGQLGRERRPDLRPDRGEVPQRSLAARVASQLSTSAFHVCLSASGAKEASNEFRASTASRASS